MKNTLQTKYKYKNTKVLTDRNITRYNNVLQILDRLVKSSANVMFFQYSGHGTQTRDYNGDEKDNLDEALYISRGSVVTDDQIQRVVKNVDYNSTMIFIVDACHSGTILDLPYQMDNDNNVVKINDNKYKGDIVCITGCRDSQVSLDINENMVWYGAMSNALQGIIRYTDVNTLTWKELVTKLRSSLKAGNYAQIPQLCVSRKELVDQKVNL